MPHVALALSGIALLFASRQVLFSSYLGDIAGTVLALLASIPYVLHVGSLARSDTPVSRSFAPKWALFVLALLGYAALRTYGQAMGSLAHGPGRHDDAAGFYFVLIASHLALTAWVAMVLRGVSFQRPDVITRAKRSLLVFGVIAALAIALALVRAVLRR